MKKIKEPKMERETKQKFPGVGFIFNIIFWKALRHVPAAPATKISNWYGLKTQFTPCIYIFCILSPRAITQLMFKALSGRKIKVKYGKKSLQIQITSTN